MAIVRNAISLDTDERRAHPFRRRQLADAFMMHLADGLMLLLALLGGDAILLLFRDIPIQLHRMLIIIPAWWIGSWFVHLVPGWGLGVVEELRRVQLLLMTIFAAATVALFLSRPEGAGSRITFLTAYMFAAILIPLGRALAKRILYELNLWGVPASIYGSRETIPDVAEALKQDRGLGFVPSAVMSDDYRKGEVVAGLPVLGRLNNVTRRTPVAVVALGDMPREELIGLLEGPLDCYHTLLLVPDLKSAPSLWVKPCDLQGILGLEIQRNLLDPVASAVKTLGERILVFLTLPIWGSLCLFLMVLIWLEDQKSPVFSQERIGRNYKKFKTYKLRTMVPNAELVLKKKLAQSEALRKEWEAHYKLKKDPRITFVGRFLRKTSLDELPQLWCVLCGSMALVGPRPLPDYHHEELDMRTQRLRTKVLPGITGLWQVSGRSDSGTAGMNRWDTYYVTNWSIWLDVIILARTFRVVLFGSGAY